MSSIDRIVKALGSAAEKPRSYQSAPDSLMGFRRNGPQTGFNEGNYGHTQHVEVSFGDGDKFVDAIKGLNQPHAVERAYRNWKGADIRPLTEAEARSIDPSLFDPKLLALGGATALGAMALSDQPADAKESNMPSAPNRVDVPGMGIVEFPAGMSDEQITAAIKANMPANPANPANPAADFAKSVPRGMLSGLSSALSAGGQAAQIEMGQPIDVPSGEQTTGILEKNITGELHKPQGRAGRFGAAMGESLGNPGSYVGPGSAPLKIGGAILSALGGEAGGQAAEGTAYEGPARLAGALAGGATAAKTFGPAAPRAAVPNAKELRGAADQGYEVARNSGLELDPKGVGSWAQTVEQELNGKGFTGGQNGTAPKTLAALGDLQRPPAGAVAVTPPNIDAVRSTLRNIAQETQPSTGGAIVPTRDAAAATKALEHFGQYTENIPTGHILAGDAPAYVRATKDANGNYGAFARVRDFDARLTKAERATDRQVAGSLDSQIKQKAGQVLDRGARGLNDAERAQLELINSGSTGSNILRQLGRGGAGVIPIMAQAATAVPLAAATGGASVLPQAAIAAALYGARKGSEAITKSRANKLVEMLAKRSPEYESRVANLPAVSSAPNKAAMIRALLASASR